MFLFRFYPFLAKLQWMEIVDLTKVLVIPFRDITILSEKSFLLIIGISAFPITRTYQLF